MQPKFCFMDHLSIISEMYALTVIIFIYEKKMVFFIFINYFKKMKIHLIDISGHDLLDNNP